MENRQPWGMGFLLFLIILTATPAAATSPGEALIEAAIQGDLQCVRALLAQGVSPDVHDEVHNTALIFAARDGHLKIVRELLAAGAGINWQDDERVTPLILAAFKGHADIVKLLLAHGANPKIRDQWGRTALDYAQRRGPDHPIARLLQPAAR